MAKEEKKEKRELTIYEKLSKIQQELKVPKEQFNKFANFKYRSQEDILEAVKPLLGDLVLTISDEPILIGDRYYIQATARLTDDGVEYIVCKAYARESEIKKGMDDSQITGTASSYARKYALNGLFLIDDTNDIDSKNNEENEASESKKGDEVLASRLRIKIKNALFVEDLEALRQEIADAGSTLTKEQFQSVVDEAKKKKVKLEEEFSNIDETDYE